MSGGQKLPNVLILLSDQRRWNTLRCYGNFDEISALCAGLYVVLV